MSETLGLCLDFYIGKYEFLSKHDLYTVLCKSLRQL